MSPWGVELVERIGIALLHSLWQGALAGSVLLAALLALRRARSQLRYLASCFALACMLLLPAGTFFVTGAVSSPTGEGPPRRTSRLATSAAAALEAAATLLPQELPDGQVQFAEAAAASESAFVAPAAAERRWLSTRAEALLLAMVAAWSLGVVLLSCRVLGGYLAAWRLSRRWLEPLEEIWYDRFRRLAARLGVRAAVELWQSASIEAPVVIGCFRPVVLVPVGILTGLSVAQIEAILAHELAHIRRYDFLVNAVQCAVETLLFYHPCVWWISARIRSEREHCCDEIAVAACGDALAYARALNLLEERRSPGRLALALTDGSLLSRVRRIVGQRRTSDVVGGWLAGSLAILLPLSIGATWAWGRATAGASAETSLFGSFRGNAAGSDAPVASEERLLRDATELTNELAGVLAEVVDARSAAAAAEKLVEFSRRHAEIDRRLRELRRTIEPDAETRLALRWTREIEHASRRLRAEVARIEKLPGAVDALRSSVLFAAIGFRPEPPPAAPAGPAIDFLIPPWATPRGMHAARGDPLEQMFADHGPQHVVKVVVTGLPGDVYDEVYARLRQILPNLGYVGSGAGDTATIYLAPISDIDYFASQIELGQVSSIDRANRTITVVADRSRLSRAPRGTSPPPAEPAEPGDLASLGQRLARRDRSATEELIALGAVGEATAIEYAAHSDRRVRREALLALKKIAGSASLPAAIQALADEEPANRDLAWQVVCHLPGAAQRPEVIAAAAAQFERDAEQAGHWLTSIGPAAESALLPFTRHRSAEVRRQAAGALKAIGGNASLAPLERLLDDPEPTVAAAARRAHDAIARRQRSK